MPPSKKRILLFTIFAYLLLVGISVYLLVLKRDLLQFHTRDYAYFIEQAAKISDPNLTRHFAFNISGYNFLGLQGDEGVKSIYQAIHTEYFRYTYALLYWIFHSTLPIYIFYCLIFYLPILYVGWLTHNSKFGPIWKQVVFFVLLFGLFPATLNSVTFDLRPRMLFITGWSLLALAIYYERPFWEKLLFFGLLISLREEGILMGAILITLNFAIMRGKTGRWAQTLLFSAVDILAIILFAAFMAWGGYTRVEALLSPLNFINNMLSYYPVFAIGGPILLILAIGYVWIKKRTLFDRLLPHLIYSAGILLTGLQWLRGLLGWYEVNSILTPLTGFEIYINAVASPEGTLVFYLVILLLVLPHGSAKYVSWGQGALSLFCIIFAATTLLTVPPQINAWNQNLQPARLVWDFKNQMDRYKTKILVDYDTHQAFYDCENVLVYNRLPLWMVQPEYRFYPDNQAVLAKVINEQIEYVVIARKSLENIRGLAQIWGTRVTEVVSNEQYVILKVSP